MKVIDIDRSEHGPQRRKDARGRHLHSCCVCGHLSHWTESWSWYGSFKDLVDSEALAKFCSPSCADTAGADCDLITNEMRERARNAEWREPKLAYREATDREKYRNAKADQKRRALRAEKAPQG
jgi:hypothetical protein